MGGSDVLQAYSRLKFLLEERSLTTAELQRRLASQERAFNQKTLYRLVDPDRPLERIDLRVAGAVCRTLGVGLSDLIVFAESDGARLRSLAESQQQRLDELMDRHNEGELAGHEIEELRGLVDEAEALSHANARRLAEHRRRLRRAETTGRHVSAG